MKWLLLAALLIGCTAAEASAPPPRPTLSGDYPPGATPIDTPGYPGRVVPVATVTFPTAAPANTPGYPGRDAPLTTLVPPATTTPVPVTGMLASVVVTDMYAIAGHRVNGVIYFQVTAYDQNGRVIPTSALTIRWIGTTCGLRKGVLTASDGSDIAAYNADRSGTCTVTASVSAFGRTLVATGTASVK